ncbi:MAG TPA: pentapeptide repeat-containing protein [Nitrospiraceae bacterium]|nr:pentapeptide repeat-containing protein [Nitrospiraceae bacterium]
MVNRIGAWIVVGGLAILGLPLSTAGSNCRMELAASGPGVALTRHLGADCTEQEREARAVDATELLQAFREGKGIDLSGVVIRGDLALDLLPIGPLPPELEELKDLQGREVRVIPGSLIIVNSVMQGVVRHSSAQGLLVAKGPVTFSGTKFEQMVDLSRAVFVQPVTMSDAVFLRESYFVQGRFLRDVSAEKTVFGSHTRFHRSVFQGPVTYQQSRFNGLVEFLEVVFEKDADLSRTSFKLGTGFSGSRFQGLANFSDASFDREAYFTYTLFDGDTDFRGTTFRSTADFSNASFKGRDDFSKTSFKKSPQFTGAARLATGQSPPVPENQMAPYAIGLSILTLIALLIIYLIRSH